MVKALPHRNGISWPRARLSEDFSCAPMTTFGCDADADADVVRFYTIPSSNRLDNHGKSLAYTLLDQQGRVCRRRVLFIVHSLAGLVCEEALNLNDKRQDIRII